MRSWHGKVTSNVFLCVSTFLMAYEYVASTIYAPNACYNGWIIIACTISMEFHPLYDIEILVRIYTLLQEIMLKQQLMHRSN